MGLLTDVKTRIETLPACTSGGYVVKRGEMPQSPDKIICVYEYPGNPAELGFGRPGLQYISPGLQVSVRGAITDYDGPHAIIQQVFEDLPKIQGTTLSPSGTLYHMFTANQTPFLMARDGGQRCIWAVNFIVKYEI
jgi:hypothetical protein